MFALTSYTCIVKVSFSYDCFMYLHYRAVKHRTDIPMQTEHTTVHRITEVTHLLSRVLSAVLVTKKRRNRCKINKGA